MDRRTQLKDLIAARFAGNQRRFAAEIKRSPAQVGHWLSGHRKLGDAGARDIEITLGLGQGYFDGVFKPALVAVASNSDVERWPFELVSPKEYAALELADRQAIEDFAYAKVGRSKQRRAA